MESLSERMPPRIRLNEDSDFITKTKEVDMALAFGIRNSS